MRDLMRGLMLGGIATYFLDRTRGHQRRAALRDKASHFLHELEDAAGKTTRDARNRGEGLRAAAAARADGAQVDDIVLHERVRSALGRVVTHPGSIEVGVQDGHVSLRGPVLAREVRRLLSAVRRVRGVRGVHNELTEHESAEGISWLQGGRPRESRFELRQRNWSPAARFVTGLIGAAGALGSRDLPRPLRGLVRWLGLGIMTRAATNLELKRLVGVTGGRRVIDIHKTITVAAPIDQVFDFWSRIENFPLFMSHLKDVERTGERTSHWIARGPAGTEFHWDAEITALEPQRTLAWRSADGATIKNAGIIHFEEADGGTRVDIHLCYNPPAGALGHGFASLFGADAKHALDDDLVRFKSLLEEGRATADGTTVQREELPGESIRLPRRTFRKSARE